MSAVDEYHRLMASKTLKPSKKVTRDAIAELEARVRQYQDELVDKHNALLDAEAKMVEEHEARCLSIRHATGLEAEVERLRKGLRLIIERSPGQAHRIAIQMLDPARAEEGGE